MYPKLGLSSRECHLTWAQRTPLHTWPLLGAEREPEGWEPCLRVTQGAMLAVPGVPPLSPTHQLLPGKGQLSLRATWPCLSPCVCPPSRAQLLWGWEGASRGGRTGGVGGEKFAIFFFLRDFFFLFF